MVGGGSRKDDGSQGISSNNVFAALDSLRKKKKSDASKGKASAKSQLKQAQPQVFWAPTPLTAKSWADVDDDDDDDYYATTAPLQPVWGSSEPQNKESSAPVEEETESEDDDLDEIDDVEEEPEHEPEVQQLPAEPVTKPPPASLVPKDAERQLSKKELKKKELAELDAVLAELGISTKDNIPGQTEPHGTMEENKLETDGDAEKKDNASAPSESKTSKKKKKKEKSSKDVKELQEKPNAADGDATDEASAELAEDASTVDVERLKKMVSMKKKKSSKEMDAAAKAASVEAAARSAKLAAAKKKEKNHYNQQPVR